jgi:hypothetical protein
MFFSKYANSNNFFMIGTTAPRSKLYNFMFSLSKKQPAQSNREIEANNNNTNVNNSETAAEENNNQELIFKENSPKWEDNLNWADDLSWSRVLMSDAETLKQTGTVTTQKDSLLVVLVRRLEAFPQMETISSVRNLIESEINRLKSVKTVMQHGQNSEQNDKNPILVQAKVEVESELTKVMIEKKAFEDKLEGEIRIINNLIDNIIKGSEDQKKMHDKIIALAHIFNFEEDENNKVYHLSTLPAEILNSALEKSAKEKMEAERKLEIQNETAAISISSTQKLSNENDYINDDYDSSSSEVKVNALPSSANSSQIFISKTTPIVEENNDEVLDYLFKPKIGGGGGSNSNNVKISRFQG